MSKTILVGCKLPNGLTVYGTQKQPITLNGMNTCMIMGGYGVTHVDADEHAFIFAVYAEHDAFKSQAIFTADSAKVDDIISLGDELRDEKTGLEGIDPANPGEKGGDGDLLKPSDKQVVRMAEEPATVRVKNVKNAADKAAAAELASKLAS